jgi:hypothetical protein
MRDEPDIIKKMIDEANGDEAWLINSIHEYGERQYIAGGNSTATMIISFAERLRLPDEDHK